MATGRCECSGVMYSVDGPLRDVFNCHCHRCRRITGHHFAATQANTDDVKFTSDETLTWYSPDPTVRYGFCSTCGSTLFWQALDEPHKISICAGALDTPTGLRTTQAWYVSHASDYHVRPADLIEYPTE